MPFSVLRDVTIDPPLSGRHAEAVQSLESQPVTQMYFAHRSDFWNEDGYAPSMFTDGPAGMFAAARNGRNPEEVTSFTAWIMGPKAKHLASLPEEDGVRAVLGAIESVRPAAKGKLEYLGCKAWDKDPGARGAWAYFKPGQIAKFAATMVKSHGRIHFCGEHLALAARGMEGTMESGERVAREIIST